MASRSLNKVILIGNLTRDPELKYTPAGTAVCAIGVATNRSWTTATGTRRDEVQYHRIVAWQKLAELAGKLLTKGRKIYLEGRITYRSFTGRDGTQKSLTEIVMDDFIVFGDGKRINEEVSADSAKTEETTATSEIPESEIPEAESKATEPTKPEKKKNEENQDVNPDDIPF